MSFTGDLEHLPIVDILQLLHATRKSGVLRVASRKGESLLVLKDGYIVSANHLNNSVRIGDVLVRRGAITPEILDQALREQEQAGAGRKPLIVTLLDNELVKEDDAYRGLEELIEMTVVEILTWKRGTFVLDVQAGQVVDGYRFYPTKIDREINVDTQGVLMDSLRIFDEKVRDGALAEEEPEDSAAGGGPVLSADDLGLADFEQLERKIPRVFTGLADHDPAKVHRQKLDETVPTLPPEKRDELAAFLAGFSAPEEEERPLQGHSLVLFTADKTLQHCITTVCKNAGIPVFATNDEQDLEPIFARSLSRNTLPLLVFDAPETADGNSSAAAGAPLLRRCREHYPQVPVIQLAPPDDAALMLAAYADGARGVLPRPPGDPATGSYAADLIRFLPAFKAYVRASASELDNPLSGRLRETVVHLRQAREIQDVALAVLEFVAGIFDRAVTLVVRETELVGERSIGLTRGRERTAASLLGFRIPLAGSSLLRSVVDTGKIHYGITGDAAVRDQLFGALGAPRHPSVLLLPLRMRGRIIALVYGDFGDREIAAVDLDLLEIVTNQAELVLDNAAYRKKLE